jgi:hypothetical protein
MEVTRKNALKICDEAFTDWKHVQAFKQYIYIYNFLEIRSCDFDITVARSDIQHFTFTTQLYLINDNKYRSLVT